LTANATENNPNLPTGVPEIAYEITDVTVDVDGYATVTFIITADGTMLDLNNLPDGFVDGDGEAFRWPGFLMSYALPQNGIETPADYNNLGRSAAQPMSVSIGDLVEAGGVDCSGGMGCVADFSTTDDAFPISASLRAIGIQGYFQYDVDGDESSDYSLHTPSDVRHVNGDAIRRTVVDSDKCANCHEWFEGHGGNRVYEVAICTQCHVPSLSTSGRSIDPVDAADSSAAEDLGTANTWTWPEDTNNLKEMIHGIHASAMRDADYEFVRGRNNGIYYNWAEVTFPAEDGTSNCLLCHNEGTYQLPLPANVLETTVRTTSTADGLDGNDYNAVDGARDSLPNDTDWVNTPVSSTCYYCHNNEAALAHMRQNGGIISVADADEADYTQRVDGDSLESCAVCHGEGNIADINEAHMLD
jgi:OmcA/MtrC family decaheme c-type cytochrome